MSELTAKLTQRFAGEFSAGEIWTALSEAATKNAETLRVKIETAAKPGIVDGYARAHYKAENEHWYKSELDARREAEDIRNHGGDKDYDVTKDAADQ